MSEDGSTDGVSKTRAVFGDLTNRPAKRNFSVFSGLKSFDGSGKNSEFDSRFAKQLRTEVKQFIQERAGTNVAEPSLSTSNNNDKDKQPCRSSSNSAETEGSVEIMGSQVSVAREPDDASTWTDLWNEACRRRASDASLTDPTVTVVGPTVTVCKESQEEGLGLGSKKPSSVEWSKFPSQGSQSHELGRCVNVDEDVLKNCSCSFCLKAAYIWSDLQYQDIKGRISALKRSQKEASALAQGSSKGTETDAGHGQGNPVKSSKLESDLTGQWKSLFCHMEDVLHNENNQLQASFLMLKELRENCKTDLEIINATPSQNH